MGLPLRKFLIPLSYAAILGGMCTLIGTSTNLVVHGMMLEAGLEGFTMFELGKVGIFIAIAGTLYMIFFAAKRLPGENAPVLRFSTLARPVNSMTSSTRDRGMPLVRARPRRWV